MTVEAKMGVLGWPKESVANTPPYLCTQRWRRIVTTTGRL